MSRCTHQHLLIEAQVQSTEILIERGLNQELKGAEHRNVGLLFVETGQLMLNEAEAKGRSAIFFLPQITRINTD